MQMDTSLTNEKIEDKNNKKNPFSAQDDVNSWSYRMKTVSMFLNRKNKKTSKYKSNTDLSDAIPVKIDSKHNYSTTEPLENSKQVSVPSIISSKEKGYVLISKVQRDIYCEPCATGQNENKAHGFCTNCSEYLCESCFESHKKYKAFKDHILQNKDEMPKDDENITIEDHCLKHEDKPIEYYCKSCEELACTVCMFKEHRRCQNVDYIPDIAETLEESDEYKELTNDMNNLATKCTTGWKSLEASLKQSKESKDKAISKINMETAEIKKVFDSLETKMKDEVQARYRMEQGKLIGLKEKQKALTGQLEMAKKKIEYSRKARQMIKLFISVKKERKAVDDLENELQKLKQENDTQSYTFKALKSVEGIKFLGELGELNSEDTASDWGTLMVPGATWNHKNPGYYNTLSLPKPRQF